MMTHSVQGTRTDSLDGGPTRRLLRGTAISACILIAACGHLDHFSHKATDFNIQVAEVQDRTMLLNIVRAANRYPMHFTELSTLSGTVTASVGGTLTLPFAIFNGGNSTFSAAPTGTLTDSPTFNMAVLETQEFYKGMLAPISQTQLATYVEEGLQRELIFALAFGELLYQPGESAKTAVVENNFHFLKPDNATVCVPGFKPMALDPTAQPQERIAAVKGKSEYSCFEEVLRALIEDKQLTLEQTKEVTNLGPPLPQEAFNNQKWLSGLDLKTVKVTSVDLTACEKSKPDSCPEGLKGLPSESRSALMNGQQLFRIQKETTDYRFCFDVEFHKDTELEKVKPELMAGEDLATKVKRAKVPEKLICHKRLPDDYTPPKESDDARSKGHSWSLKDAGRNNERFTLQVQPRSTEGIVYFLGEIARCSAQLDLVNSACNPLPTIHVDYPLQYDTLFAVSKSKTRQSSPDQPEQPHSQNDVPVGKDTTTDQFVVVDFAGVRYSVKIDPTAKDRSGQVLRILTQLLALNRSAKDFPAPAVVPIISH
jgi:hypothetical protein